MQRIHIEVVRSRKLRAGDSFHVYSDRGTGAMDWVHPETARRVRFWEDAVTAAGHQLGGCMMGSHLDGIRPDGHLEGTHLLDEQAYPGASVAFDSEPLAFGRFRYAVVAQDAVGNALLDGAVIHEAVINSDPPPAAGLRLVAYRSEIHQAEFSFAASSRLVG